MFGGGRNRLLPPIKNPLFNPNEGAEEVRIAAVKNSSEKSKGSRFSSFFSSKHRNSSSSSYGVKQEEEKAGCSGSSRPSTSDTVSDSQEDNNKELPTLEVDDNQEKKSSAGKARSLSSRTKFSRNLTPNNVNNDESDSLEPQFSNSEKTKINIIESKKSGLLKRGKEKPPSLTSKNGTGESSRSLQVNKTIHSQSSSTTDNLDETSQKLVETASNIPPKQEGKKMNTIKYQDALSLRNDWRLAKTSGDYKSIQSFLTSTFDSFADINAVFKKKEDCLGHEDQQGSCLDYDFVRITYDIVLTLPQEVQKTVLKSIINGLLQDMKRQRTDDDLRAYIILLQVINNLSPVIRELFTTYVTNQKARKLLSMIYENPQFSKSTTYVIFAHLLRQVSALSDNEHQNLVLWFRKVPVNTYKSIVSRIEQFLSLRLFPTKSMDLPPEEKCTWWVPSAVKVLALLNAANWLQLPPLTSHTYFYNHSLDHIDLMEEYYSWQKPGSNSGKFSFCQYPFILSLAAKRYVMQKDSESQMIVMARKSLMEKVQRREMPDMGMLFLNIKVRRSHLITDSLNEIARKQKDLKKKLKVTFAGEPGLDMGGLTKEWFLLLIRKIFKPEYGMFTYHEKSRVYWFNSDCQDQDEEFNLVGVLMGLAVYNSIILDIHFPSCVYKKLLSPAVVPYHNPNATVGIANLSLDDLAEVMPDLTRGLRELLSYEGDVENDLCQTFQISYTSFGEVLTHSLKPNGNQIPVTKENRSEYVNLYVDYLLNKSMYKQFAAFYHGFHSVCASNALIMLRPEEVEMLVCGNPELDMEALKKVTVYDGYNKTDPTIRYFWELVLGFPTELKKKTLLFVTGSDRIPIGGLAEMEFKICKMDTAGSTSIFKTENIELRFSSTLRLPMAHTCFNQLCLPPYKSRKQIKQKLTIAISNAEGFGIE